MASDLTPVELKIFRHYFMGWHDGALVIDPDGAIARVIQSFRGRSSLWNGGPCYQTTRQGIELQQNASGEAIAILTWPRVKQWVLDPHPAERDALCSAETVYRQRRRSVADANGVPDDTDLGVREAEAVRDTAFQRCVDASAAAAQLALLALPGHQAVL
jgi:hypothetical protein